ncbi:DUF2127 domain-containing protein [Candidatus Uhrbacteria bacterium]|nr:DUF2127 domain-containing protein [Candidatus Uhrbacteria bacterium]
MTTWFHRPWSIVVLAFYKAFLGALEFLVGLILLIAGYVIAHDQFTWVFYKIVEIETKEDPQDLFVHWLLSQNLGALTAQSMKIGVALLLLGVIKLTIAWGLWFESRLIRNLGLVFLIASGIFGLYSLYEKFSLVKLAALGVDLFFIYYFWKIFPKYFRPAGL